MRNLKIFAIVLATVLAACAQDAPTTIGVEALSAASSRSAVTSTVPFTATFYFTPGLTPVPPEVCATELADIAEGHGEGSSPAGFAGVFSGRLFSCVNLATLEATDGQFRFTAHDNTEADGTYELSGEWLEPGVLAVEGPFAIVGGTRRLRGATGGGTVTGVINFITNEGILSFDGVVSHPR